MPEQENIQVLRIIKGILVMGNNYFMAAALQGLVLLKISLG
jgi:hypothetical protein